MRKATPSGGGGQSVQEAVRVNLLATVQQLRGRLSQLMGRLAAVRARLEQQAMMLLASASPGPIPVTPGQATAARPVAAAGAAGPVGPAGGPPPATAALQAAAPAPGQDAQLSPDRPALLPADQLDRPLQVAGPEGHLVSGRERTVAGQPSTARARHGDAGKAGAGDPAAHSEPTFAPPRLAGPPANQSSAPSAGQGGGPAAGSNPRGTGGARPPAGAPPAPGRSSGSDFSPDMPIAALLSVLVVFAVVSQLYRVRRRRAQRAAAVAAAGRSAVDPILDSPISYLPPTRRGPG